MAKSKTENEKLAAANHDVNYKSLYQSLVLPDCGNKFDDEDFGFMQVAD